MRFASPLQEGTLLRRYKRFFADVRLDDGTELCAHVANTGSMLGCAEPGSRVALSHHPGKKRKLPHSLELVRAGDAWIGVNTALPNHVVHEAIVAGGIRELRGYDTLRREVVAKDGSRIDLLLESPGVRCWVEVKSVTLADGPRALFPDAVTTRGTRHLHHLRDLASEGHRAVIFLLVNRTDCTRFAPAWDIDPTWSEALVTAAASGVTVLCYRAAIDLDGITVGPPLPIDLTR